MLLMYKNICSDAWLETLLWLLPAFLLGLLLGWLIWGRRLRELTNQIGSLETDLKACRNEKDRLNTQISSLKASGTLGANANNNAQPNQDAALRTRIAGLEKDLADCQATKNASIAAAAIAGTAAISGNSGIAGAAAADSNRKPDDLKKVEGIGPAIERLFHSKGILTFADLANAPVATLSEILHGAGPNFRIHNPGTWPHQSELCRDGKWDELKKLQDQLNAGKA